MQIGQHDQSGVGCQARGDFIGIEPPRRFGPPLEDAHLGLQIAQGGEEELVGRLLHQHLVAGRDESRQGQMVGEGGSSRGDHTGGRNREALGDRLDERRPAVGVGAVQIQVGHRNAEVAQGAIGDAAGGEIVLRRRLQLGEMHIV